MTERVFRTRQDAQVAPFRPARVQHLRDSRREVAGDMFDRLAVALTVRNNTGLTDTYNQFHDDDETSPEILEPRDLHTAMDRAMLDAFGWTDIPTACEFLLDYEEDEEEGAAADTGKGRKKHEPYRYRWPDAVRDEVLAHLLALNAKRAEEERHTGAAAAAKGNGKGKPARAKKPKHKADTGAELFEEGEAG